MPIPLPGAETLGYGFNIFGEYSTDSRISPLFDIQFDASREYERDGKTYLLPSNASFDPSTSLDGSTYVFETRQKVQEHFAAKAGLSARFGAFSGQFSASYAQTELSDDQYSFALVEANSKFWSLTLQDQSSRALANWVTSDPDYINIPDTYNDGNRDLFFRFFDKYGTHYVVGLKVGARLYYSSLVEKSYNYTKTEISAKLSAEYDGVFAKAGAEAEASWNKAGEVWSNRRRVLVRASGGNNQLLNILAPNYPDNFNGDFRSWLQSGPNLPAVIEFSLAGVDNLFSAEKAQAIKQAIAAYTRSRLLLESKTGGCVILYNAQPALPAGGGNDILGFQMVAVDRQSLNVVFARSYSLQRQNLFEYQPLYERALNDFAPYRNERYLIAFTTWSIFGIQYPTPGFADFLVEIGAGLGLQGWHNVSDLVNYPNRTSCNFAHVNYCLVGHAGIGAGNAFEVFNRAGSCDTGDPHWYTGEDWYDKPAAQSILEVDLFKIAENDTLHTMGLSYHAKRSAVKVLSNDSMVRAHKASKETKNEN